MRTFTNAGLDKMSKELYGKTPAEMSSEERRAIAAHHRTLAAEIEKRNARTADFLHAYMKFRANKEGAAYEFDPPFFQKHLNAGVESFFGIAVDIDKGKLIEDAQNPTAFTEWCQREVLRKAEANLWLLKQGYEVFIDDDRRSPTPFMTLKDGCVRRFSVSDVEKEKATDA